MLLIQIDPVAQAAAQAAAAAAAAEAARGWSPTTVLMIGTLIAGIVGGIPAILIAWGKMKEIVAVSTKAAAEASTAGNHAAEAADRAGKTMEQTAIVAERLNGHWSEIEKRLSDRDKQVEELLSTVQKMAAEVAAADKAAAVASVELLAAERAATAKRESEAQIAIAAAAMPPGAVDPAAVVRAPAGSVAAVQSTMNDAITQLDAIESTGNDTNKIVDDTRDLLSKKL